MAGDSASVRDLIASCGLPVEDLPAGLPHFIVARQGGAIVGVVGLEAYGRRALVRSLAVHPEHRRQGLAKRLYDAIAAEARRLGARELYLLTQTGGELFERLGFRALARTEVPEEIVATRQFAGLCPQSARVMTREI